jgi:hypothetical protein
MIVNKSKTGRALLHVGGNPNALDHTYVLRAGGNGNVERCEPLPAPSLERVPSDHELRAWRANYGCDIPDNLTIKVYK